MSDDTRKAIAKVEELLASGEAARRIEASRPQYEALVKAFRAAEKLDPEQLRRVVDI